MAKNKNKIAFWVTIILVIIMVAAIFVPMSIMRGTMADTTEQLGKTYNDDFTMTWSNIDDRPLSDTFNAIMQSNTTGITYEADITDGKAIIADYETENKNATVNTFVEQAIDNSFALSKLDGEAVNVYIISTQIPAEDTLKQIADQLKVEFQLTTVTFGTFEVIEEVFVNSTEHYGSLYQRSTLPLEAFDSLQTPVQNFTF